jgi:nucleoside 2-deoxyribosyltransferase
MLQEEKGEKLEEFLKQNKFKVSSPKPEENII